MDVKKKTGGPGIRRSSRKSVLSETASSQARKKSKFTPVLPSTNKIKQTKKKIELTVPISPKLHSSKPQRLRSHKNAQPKISMTSKELLQIQKERQEMQQIKLKREKYRQQIYSRSSAFDNKENNGTGSSFTMTLRSAGVSGIPAIRHRKVTKPKAFDFEIDRRAILKQTNKKTSASLAHENTEVLETGKRKRFTRSSLMYSAINE